MQIKNIAAVLAFASLQGALAAPVAEAESDAVKARAEQVGQGWPGVFDPDFLDVDVFKRSEQDFDFDLDGWWDVKRSAEAEASNLHARAEQAQQAKQGQQGWYPGVGINQFNNPLLFNRRFQNPAFFNPGFQRFNPGFGRFNNPLLYGRRGWW